ncbi:MAG: hypothetical protein ACI9VM_000347, partial [Candidatus Azotimanducaceae bacterium]
MRVFVFIWYSISHMEAVIRTAIEEVLKDLKIEGVDFVVEHPS